MAFARRQFLSTSAYSVAGLALPDESWWQDAADRASSRPAASRRRIGAGDVEAVQEMTGFFQQRDQRHGGGHGRSAVTAYLVDEVADMLNGTFRDERVRRELLSTAGELIYLTGWMAFDAGQHAEAQTHFTLAIRLAAEATDPALAAHVMRAMAHQAVDLGHYREALQLSSATMDRSRYGHACPRERALLGVVHARALAVAGQKKAAATALLQAEEDLAAATTADEPGRMFFFKEASLAHETACTLRDIGDFAGAQREFKRSVRTRKATTYARTHAVTLGYLGAVQARTDGVEAACATWNRALDAMEGVQSRRALDTVTTMRQTISPFRYRGITAVAELEARTAAVLRQVA
ncbi:Tat pathway signal protein [Streptomyces sp. NBC_01304]|uniref:Tat pathway signal protein n=1 Tax=Streptomyces sp. NBC_01304 TaxID=2903818 RepID=UPI002E13BECD|nr:Tat pathway signal protein [Streptomyces sp. NBC_01304]